MSATSVKPYVPPITVEKTEDGYQLTCLEAGLTVKADTIDDGYLTLVDAVERQPRLVSPKRHDGATAPSARRLWLIPVTVAFIVILIGTAAIPAVRILHDVRTMTGTLSGIFQEIETLTPSQISAGVQNAIDTIGKLTPERQEELRQSVEIASEAIAPIVGAVRPILEELGLADESVQPNPNDDEASTSRIPASPRQPSSAN